MDMKKKELRAEIERLERENSNIRGENNVLAVQVDEKNEHISEMTERFYLVNNQLRTQTILARAYRDRWLKSLNK